MTFLIIVDVSTYNDVVLYEIVCVWHINRLSTGVDSLWYLDAC